MDNSKLLSLAIKSILRRIPDNVLRIRSAKTPAELEAALKERRILEFTYYRLEKESKELSS